MDYKWLCECGHPIVIDSSTLFVSFRSNNHLQCYINVIELRDEFRDHNHNRIAACSRNGDINIYDTVVLKYTLKGHTDAITDVIILMYPNDNMFASASLDNTIRIWIDDKCVQILTGHSAKINCLIELSHYSKALEKLLSSLKSRIYNLY